MNDSFLETWRQRVESELERLLPNGQTWPARLHRAIRHSVFAGGKRLRPVLVLAAARACGGDLESILPAACGLEMIHTYSLIHDDLPALDNDDWRRGVPTCHKEYGEATAILAGDALLTHGLGCLAAHPDGPTYDAAKVLVLKTVVDAIGTQGMIGGQMEDLEAEKEAPGGGAAARERLERIHSTKTGRLISACLQTGGLLSFVPEARLRDLVEYGRSLGLAFQIKDDLLDVESSREVLGKETGKDSAKGKLTFPGIYGVEESRRVLEATISSARNVASRLEPAGGPLRDLADYVSRRKN
jgi:geranylgeranyl diphosphate synthase type II